MDVYILCVLLTESFAVCGSKREHFLDHPWQHWQFCMSCPWSPSGVKAFTWDISTPLRHGHDIPEGCPRAVKLLLLLQLPSSCLLSCASTQFCMTVCHSMCVVSCKLQLKDASDLLFISLIKGAINITLVLWRSLCFSTILGGAVEWRHHLPCSQSSHIHNLRSRLLSIPVSLGCSSAHCANLLSSETLSSLMAFSL